MCIANSTADNMSMERHGRILPSEKRSMPDPLYIVKAVSLRYRQVSWLVTFLPPSRPPQRTMDLLVKTGVLLTVARQPVIYTRFLINSGQGNLYLIECMQRTV